MRFMKRVLLCLLACVMPLCALGQELPCTTLQVEATIGYDGVMTYGKCMPLRIRLENPGQALSATVAVNIRAGWDRYDRHEMPVTLAANEVKELCIPIQAEGRQETFTVEVWDGGEKLCAVNACPTLVANPAAMLVGVLSPTPEKLGYMNIDTATDEMFRGEYMQTVPLTAETFPDTAELLASFGMLAVDSFDVGQLNENQRTALWDWLKSGEHILLLGGGTQAGVTWPAFAGHTGLAAGGVMAADVTSGLLQWLGAVGVPAGKNVTIATAAGDPPVAQVDGTPLVWRRQVGNSRIYTTSFSLADSVLTSWAPMHTFWQRVLVKDCYSLYQRCLYPSTSPSGFNYAVSRLPLDGDVPLWPGVLAAAGIMVLGGLAAYILLKRADRRQWLWAVLPGLAAVSAGIVWVMALGSGGAQPTALSVSVYRQTGSESSLSTSLAIGMPDMGEMLVTSSEGTLHTLDRGGYYDAGTTTPVTRRYRYLLGETSGIGMDTTRAWDMRYLLVKDLPIPTGGVETSAWMEADGLHATVTNNSQLRLDEGVLLCNYGFCAVPALAPGEGCTLTLVKTAANLYDAYPFGNGCMYEGMAGTSLQTYNLPYQYHRFRAGIANQPEATLDVESTLMTDLMAQVLDHLYSDEKAYGSTLTRFFYLAGADGLAVPEISVNGHPVTRGVSRSLAAVEVPFATVQDGRICYLPGDCQPVRCQVDAQGVPYCHGAQASQNYHRLSDSPVFMFQPEGLPATIDRLAFHVDYMPRDTQAYLYTGTDWVAYTMGEDVPSPQQYMDEEGRIFLQLRWMGSAEEYHEVSTPSMTLEGRTR